MEGTHNLEELLYRFRWQILLFLLGLGFLGVGFYSVSSGGYRGGEVEVLGETSEVVGIDLTVEIGGAVVNPGVYEFGGGARVNDLIEVSGGLSDDADIVWVEKTLNRASKLTDGQKVYIPSLSEQSGGENASDGGVYQSGSTGNSGGLGSVVNVNEASVSELEELWGIGPKTAQIIIEQRPYSFVEELLDKGILKSNVYERNVDFLSVY